MPEYMDIYDKNYQKTGRLYQRGSSINQGDFYLVVNVWIINNDNKILLSQRHPDKKIWGGLWECSASGAVLAGETSLQGAIRETKEELGIDLSPQESILLETIFRKNDIRDTFLFKKNIQINDLIFQPTEVINAKWVQNMNTKFYVKKKN